MVNKTGDEAANPLKGLGEVTKAAGKGLPPVHLWNPPFCGSIDMRIDASGNWFYMNSPIGRKELVRLFSTILRHDDDGVYYMVTPVEKVSVEVEDAPFAAVRMTVEGEGIDQVLGFETNVDDEVVVDKDHPLRFEIEAQSGGLKPYVLVRDRLEALVTRALSYDIVALGVVKKHLGEPWFGVMSSGIFWPIALADEIGVELDQLH